MLQETLKETEETIQMVESLTIERDNCESKLEAVKKELALMSTENKKLIEDKKKAEIELEEAMIGAISDSSQSGDASANTELIKNNARLRQAIQSLND
jgi:hypothetical protein